MKQEDLAFYGAFAPKLQEIHDLMLHEIQAILDSISTDSEKAPAEHLKCRIKGAESLKEKLRKNGLPQTPAGAGEAPLGAPVRSGAAGSLCRDAAGCLCDAGCAVCDRRCSVFFYKRWMKLRFREIKWMKLK